MNEVRYPIGKKHLVAVHNDSASAIVIKYDPPGGTFPKALMGDFTTFEKAGETIKEYIRRNQKG